MEDSWSFLFHVHIFSNNLIDSSYDTYYRLQKYLQDFQAVYTE